MKLLLDTQCWLWMLMAPERFTAATHAILIAPENELYLSAASSWEIAIKYALGKLRLPGLPGEVVPGLMARSGVVPLPVHHAHALQVAQLPPHHRDPFDRLLVAQAQLEGLPILTADRSFRPYDVEVMKP